MNNELLNLLLMELEKFSTSDNLVQLKELKDYLCEKNENAKLDTDAIRFDDEEDKDYFNKVTSELGIDFYKILSDVVL